MPTAGMASTLSRPPTMSRRDAAGPVSARGLLFTVLGEFVLPAGGSAWTTALVDVLGRLGVEEKAARQALMRTAAEGWLISHRHGRRTLWTLSPSGERLLTEGADRIYAFTGAQRDWDGRWVLVLARTPETERPTRHRLRTRLTWAGFGSPSPGVWVSTHADRAAEAERVLAEAGVGDAQIFLATHHSGGELTAMVRQAWDLDAIEADYEHFLADFAKPHTPDPLTRLVQLVHAWRRFPAIDPELPRALLPARWCGERAAALFAKQHAKWATEAGEQWAQLDDLDTRRSNA